MDILVHIFRSSGIRVCLSRFCCLIFSNCHSVCQRLSQVLSILFVRRFMVQLLEGFFMYSLSEVLVSKGFFRSWCFDFVGLHVVSEDFFQVLYVCQSFGC